MQLTLKNGNKYTIKEFEIRRLPDKTLYFFICHTKKDYEALYKERSLDKSSFDEVAVDWKKYNLTGQKNLVLENESLHELGYCLILNVEREGIK
jgi:hypothetical protein